MHLRFGWPVDCSLRDSCGTLLICYYGSRPFGTRVRRVDPCAVETAGERLGSPHGSTRKKRSFFPGPIDDWRDALRAPVIYGECQFLPFTLACPFQTRQARGGLGKRSGLTASRRVVYS